MLRNYYPIKHQTFFESSKTREKERYETECQMDVKLSRKLFILIRSHTARAAWYVP